MHRRVMILVMMLLAVLATALLLANRFLGFGQDNLDSLYIVVALLYLISGILGLIAGPRR